MSKFSKILAGIGILAAVVVVGVLVGYWASSSGPTSPTVTANPAATEQPGARTTKVDPAISMVQPPVPKPKPLPAIPPPTAAATNLVPDWEEKVDAILTSDDPDPEKAKKMLAMFPLLSGDAQEEVAHHLSNLTPDEDYAAFGSYLTNSTLSEAVLDVLLEDVLNRPNSTKLPMLL